MFGLDVHDAHTIGIIVFLLVLGKLMTFSTHSWEKKHGKGKEYVWNPKEY